MGIKTQKAIERGVIRADKPANPHRWLHVYIRGGLYRDRFKFKLPQTPTVLRIIIYYTIAISLTESVRFRTNDAFEGYIGSHNWRGNNPHEETKHWVHSLVGSTSRSNSIVMQIEFCVTDHPSISLRFGFLCVTICDFERGFVHSHSLYEALTSMDTDKNEVAY